MSELAREIAAMELATRTIVIDLFEQITARCDRIEATKQPLALLKIVLQPNEFRCLLNMIASYFILQSENFR